MKYTSKLRQELEDDIVDGRLLPGTKLDETTLAKRFEVSRTPIREALLQLDAVGLVEIRPRRGAVVSAPSMRSVIEMFETMAELEAACGRLAARRITAEDEAAIRAAHEACSAAASMNDQNAYYEENAIFHNAIYAASHNSFLAEQAAILHKRLAPLRRLQLRSRDRMVHSLAEHQGILEAVLNGDGELTARLLREHITIQGERFTDVAISLSSIGLKP
jgi:DNA-binding GntR family transcriptional regulator